VLIAGMAVRIYLAVFTEGTYDVGIWQEHAEGVQKYGLVGYYHLKEGMNHPPFISLAISTLARLGPITGIPFRVLFRAPFIAVDCGIVVLLLCMLRGSRHRFLLASFYWLNPLAIIFSAYHGNTDLAMAFFVLFSVYLLGCEEIIWAGVLFGVSLWIKLPALLAVPALVLFLPRWRRRFVFVAVAGAAAISTYLPALLADPAIVCARVFGYHGQLIQTSAGIPSWGPEIFLAYFDPASPAWHARVWPAIMFFFHHNMSFCLGLILLLCWLRRSRRTTRELAVTITGVYAIMYGFSKHWAFQYFAWSVPLWCLADPAFAVAATAFSGGYIYLLYAFLCGNPWLLGKWDFMGHPFWPERVLVLRDAALVFFEISTCVLLACAAVAETARLRAPTRSS
jgi:Gpi18-like mannosyltransferase